MRLFVSINLPESFYDCFCELQNKLDVVAKTPECEAKCLHTGGPAIFHLTLCFLGDVRDELVGEISDELAKIKFKPFKLKLIENVDCFCNDGIVKSVFLGVDSDDDGYRDLIDLQAKIANILKPFGFKDSRKFIPHFTLSRVKKSGPKFLENAKKISLNNDAIDRELHGELNNEFSRGFTVDSFHLMRSRLGSYDSIQRFTVDS